MNKTDSYFLIILATFIWSTSGAFIKVIQLTPTSFAFIRMLVPMLLVLPFLGNNARKVLAVDNRLMLGASFLNVVRLYCFFTAYTYAPISLAAIVLNTWPIFANLFSFLILKEEVPKRNILFMGIAFSGIILINLDNEISLENTAMWGVFAAIGSAIFNALTIVIYKKQSNKYTWQETIFYQNLLGALCFAPFFFSLNPLPSLGQIAGTFSFAVLIGIIAFGLFFRALRNIEASKASLLANLEVVSAVFIGIVLFNESFTLNLVIGGGLILVSAMAIRK